jgi:hypothetical protein
MEVAEDYESDASLFGQRESGSDRPGIQKHGAIDEKSTGLLSYQTGCPIHDLIGSMAP